MRTIVILLVLAFIAQSEAKFSKASERRKWFFNKIGIKMADTVKYQTPYELCLNFDNLSSGEDYFDLKISTTPAGILSPINVQLSPLTKQSCYDIKFSAIDDQPELTEFHLNVTVDFPDLKSFNNSKILRLSTVHLKKLEEQRKKSHQKYQSHRKANKWQANNETALVNSNGTNSTTSRKGSLLNIFDLPIFNRFHNARKLENRKSHSVSSFISKLIDEGPLQVPQVPLKKLENKKATKSSSLTGPGSIIDYIVKLINGEVIDPNDFPNFVPKSSKKHQPKPLDKKNSKKFKDHDDFFGKKPDGASKAKANTPTKTPVKPVANKMKTPTKSNNSTTTAKLIEATTIKSVDIITNKPIEVTTIQPAEVTTITPVVITAVKPVEVTIIKPVEVITTKPVEVTTIKPVEVTTIKPVEVVKTTLAPIIEHANEIIPTVIAPAMTPS